MLYIFTENSKKTLGLLENIDNLKIIYMQKNGRYSIEYSSKDKVLYMPAGVKYKPPVLNSKFIGSYSGAFIAKNKVQCRKFLYDKGISVPKTWFKIEETEVPYIARPNHHSFGQDFYIINNRAQRRKFLIKQKNNRDKNWYYSEIIEVKKEYRVMILNNEIFLVYNRELFETLEQTLKGRERLRRTNSFNRYECANELTQEQKNLCIEAFKVLNLGYGAADLIVDKNGKGYIVEINTSPMLHGKLVREELYKAVEKLANECK